MTDVRTARLLGFVSLGLGAAELTGAGPMSRVLGLRGQRRIVRAFGAREILTGLYVLGNDDQATGMWGRVAGDAMDLALLAGAAARGGRRAPNALVTLAAVAGIAAIDVAVALSLTRRDASALATAKLTKLPARHRPARVHARVAAPSHQAVAGSAIEAAAI